MQVMQLRKESLKKFRFAGNQTLTSVPVLFASSTVMLLVGCKVNTLGTGWVGQSQF